MYMGKINAILDIRCDLRKKDHGRFVRKELKTMRDSIIMTKYQGFGNDYLVLDAKKNQLQLQGKKVALLCQRGFGLGADGVLYGPVDINGKWECIF